jgi:hypothetical protein
MSWYQVRWVTTPTKDGLVLEYYEIVNVEKARAHASDQVLHITKDEQEARRYVAMLNKQAELENLTNVRTTGGV